MKKISLLYLLLVITFSTVQAQTVKLPNACKKILDKKFRGWKLAEIREDITAYFQKERPAYQLNLIKGDWNGDGKTDYAALIDHGKLKNAEGEIISDNRLMIAFVSAGNGYKHFRFDGGDYITVVEKGSQDYNYETQKTFRYKNDAIFDGIFEKAGISYIWNGKKFIAVVTSD